MRRGSYARGRRSRRVKVPLIHNPRSGGGRGARLAARAVRLLADAGVAAVPVATRGVGDARVRAEAALAAGAERVLALGGDGTLSEAADAVLARGGDAALGVLPGGTGNSFVRDFPEVASFAAAVASIASGRERRIDAAVARWAGGERHVINAFGVGFMAHVADLANRRYKWMGELGYTRAVLMELRRFDAPEGRLVVDGTELRGPLALVAVCNTRRTGGRMLMAPEASVTDGLLDVIALGGVSRREVLALFPKLFKGTHVADARVRVARGREVRIELASSSPLLGDGEIYGETPVMVTALPRSLRVLF